jgi:hypothetical protein
MINQIHINHNTHTQKHTQKHVFDERSLLKPMQYIPQLLCLTLVFGVFLIWGRLGGLLRAKLEAEPIVINHYSVADVKHTLDDGIRRVSRCYMTRCRFKSHVHPLTHKYLCVKTHLCPLPIHHKLHDAIDSYIYRFSLMISALQKTILILIDVWCWATAHVLLLFSRLYTAFW